MKFLHSQAFINGKWITADQTFSVTNPATGEVVANVPDLDETHTRSAIEAASAAFPAWSSLPAKQRSKILRKWFH
jgi:succinate-semialdehyde dehydrogenase/glutarate-semialdehyde dehydrogenase